MVGLDIREQMIQEFPGNSTAISLVLLAASGEEPCRDWVVPKLLQIDTIPWPVSPRFSTPICPST